MSTWTVSEWFARNHGITDQPIVSQHGDVLIMRAWSVPENARRRADNHLAEGEATGHAHVAEGEGVAVLEAPSGQRFLWAPRGARITHQEHKEQLIPPGRYEIHIVREYDHFTEMGHQVLD